MTVTILDGLVLAQGRWHGSRQPTEKELAATAVLQLDLSMSSAKIRNGGV